MVVLIWDQELRRESRASPERQLERLDWGLAMERLGFVRVEVDGGSHVGCGPGRKHLLPSGPWLAFLERLRAEDAAGRAVAGKKARARQGTWGQVADRLGTCERSLNRLRAGRGIDERVVERHLVRDGRWTLEDLYPAPPVAYVSQQAWAARYSPPAVGAAPTPRCVSPGCREAAGAGARGGFCEAHAEVLARIRGEFDHDRFLMAEGGGTTIASARKLRRGAPPTCCVPNCWSPREPGERYCDACSAEGWTEVTGE